MRLAKYLSGVVLCLTFAAQAQMQNCPAHPATLEEMRDCYRPLLIFAPDSGDALLTHQLAELAGHAAELNERNILVVINIADRQQLQTTELQTFPATQLGPDESRKLRDRFKVSDGSFAVVLVGKDGGEKMRSQKLVTVENLNHRIDAMPMRRAEQNR
jgi:hypothetical protein